MNDSVIPLPFHRLEGEATVRRIAARFYDYMDTTEPDLARLHGLDADGRVEAGVRDRFALFLIEWLGGPEAYSPTHGHPRLRMRHVHVRIDAAMRDAWLRCMARSLDEANVHGDLRAFLDARFAHVADFLHNTQD